MTNIITIDGPTSSGKSSVGLLFAKKIGFQFIDTGTIYRAATLFTLENNLDPDSDIEKIAEGLKKMDLKFITEDGEHKVYSGTRDLTDILHSQKINNFVAIVAAIAKVREAAKTIQYDLGKIADTVMMGRDIGTEIFPNAKLKFVITATPQVRARRRFEQLLSRGVDVTFKQVLEEIKKRDDQDTNRKVSPYRIPDDAIIIDTSNKTIEQSVEELIKHYQENFSIKI